MTPIFYPSHSGLALACLLVASLQLPAAAQSEATLAAEAAFRQADAKLNTTYAAFLLQLKNGAARESCVKAQRAWIGFRDAEAAFRAGESSGGGSAYAMDFMAVMAELSEQRANQLRPPINLPASGFTKPIDGSLSPNKRFVAAVGSWNGDKPEWEEVARDENRTFILSDNFQANKKYGNYLIDVAADRTVALLESYHFGTANKYNHESCVFAWSADSRWLVVVHSWRFHTSVGTVYRLNPQGEIIDRLDFLKMAEKIVAERLRTQFPKLTAAQRDAYTVSLSEPAIADDGTLKFEIEAQIPKDEDSEYLILAVVAKVAQTEVGDLGAKVTTVEARKDKDGQ